MLLNTWHFNIEGFLHDGTSYGIMSVMCLCSSMYVGLQYAKYYACFCYYTVHVWTVVASGATHLPLAPETRVAPSGLLQSFRIMFGGSFELVTSKDNVVQGEWRGSSPRRSLTNQQVAASWVCDLTALAQWHWCGTQYSSHSCRLKFTQHGLVAQAQPARDHGFCQKPSPEWGDDLARSFAWLSGSLLELGRPHCNLLNGYERFVHDLLAGQGLLLSNMC